MQIRSARSQEAGDLEAAQEIMWDAWDANDRRRRVALARKALHISPLCADAYVMLALEAAATAEEKVDLYRKGVDAGERALGKTAFRNDVGDFWSILETRPYMRARHGLAMSLWSAGRRDEAVLHYQDLLRLNPNDNQGIRYLLLDCLLAAGRDDEAADLLKRYEDDGAAAWAWSRVLLSLRRKANDDASRKSLEKAIAVNGHVPAYLLGRKKMPRRLPDYIGFGDEAEAVAYAHGGAQAWAAAPGALAWLEASYARPIPSQGRNKRAAKKKPVGSAP